METKLGTTQAGPQTIPMLIPGVLLTSFLRNSKTPYDDAAGCRMSLTVGQVKAIVDCRARIEGDNRAGYEYIEERA